MRSLNRYLSKLVNYRQSLNFRDGRCQKGLLKEGSFASQRVDKATPVGVLVKEEGSTCVADKKAAADEARKLRQLRAAARAHQIAFDPLAGPKGLMLRSDVGLQALVGSQNQERANDVWSTAIWRASMWMWPSASAP